MESTGTISSQIDQSDEQVIRHILAGEPRLFELIVRRYNARLYRIGMSMLNNPTDVEDVMQATYVKAFEHLADFESRAQFSTWLTRVFINESLHYLKKKKQHAMMQM